MSWTQFVSSWNLSSILIYHEFILLISCARGSLNKTACGARGSKLQSSFGRVTWGVAPVLWPLIFDAGTCWGHGWEQGTPADRRPFARWGRFGLLLVFGLLVFGFFAFGLCFSVLRSHHAHPSSLLLRSCCVLCAYKQSLVFVQRNAIYLGRKHEAPQQAHRRWDDFVPGLRTGVISVAFALSRVRTLISIPWSVVLRSLVGNGTLLGLRHRLCCGMVRTSSARTAKRLLRRWLWRLPPAARATTRRGGGVGGGGGAPFGSLLPPGHGRRH